MGTKSEQLMRLEAESADRYRIAWQMACQRVPYREIGRVIATSHNRAHQIVGRAERRLKMACEVYRGPVDDPLHYGVWHEFTVKGRVGLRDERGM